MNILLEVKSLLARSPFYVYLLRIRTFFQVFSIKVFSHSTPVSTVYCISPYKSGTTYFSGLFDCKSQHEPLMHATINHMDDMDFLRKRASRLNLDLECSGFFAGKIHVLREFAPNSKVIYLSRHPELWIGSVVNYFSALDRKVSYNYVARLIFDPICGYPVESFYSLDNAKQSHLVERLLVYWIAVYSEAIQDSLSLVVPLDRIDEKLPDIEMFSGLKVKSLHGVWKRENKDKKYFKLSDYVDLSVYRDEILRLGYEV